MLFWLASMAMAGSVFVNGVNVDGLRNQTFEGVKAVTIDNDGNVQIEAPGYDIQVAGEDAGPDPTPPGPTTPTTAPPPVATAGQILPPGSVDNGLPIGQWWLISEDNGSSGHVVSIYINGQLATAIPSGQAQVIADMQPYVKFGANQVRIESQSVAAAGGTFYIYMGSGSNDSGTVVMDPPQVQFGVGPSREGQYVREFTLNVSR